MPIAFARFVFGIVVFRQLCFAIENEVYVTWSENVWGGPGIRYVAAPVGEASNPASGRFSLDGTGRFGDGNSGSDSAADARGCVK